LKFDIATDTTILNDEKKIARVTVTI